MRVLQLGGDLYLASESIVPQGGGELGPEYFYGDLAVVSQVLREVHHRHPSTAQLAQHGVSPGEGLLQTIEAIQRRQACLQSALQGWVRCRDADAVAGRKQVSLAYSKLGIWLDSLSLLMTPSRRQRLV